METTHNFLRQPLSMIGRFCCFSEETYHWWYLGWWAYCFEPETKLASKQ